MRTELTMLMALGAGVIVARALDSEIGKTKSRRSRRKSVPTRLIAAKVKSVRKAAVRKLATTAKKRIAATKRAVNGHARA